MLLQFTPLATLGMWTYANPRSMFSSSNSTTKINPQPPTLAAEKRKHYSLFSDSDIARIHLHSHPRIRITNYSPRIIHPRGVGVNVTNRKRVIRNSLRVIEVSQTLAASLYFVAAAARTPKDEQTIFPRALRPRSFSSRYSCRPLLGVLDSAAAAYEL